MILKDGTFSRKTPDSEKREKGKRASACRRLRLLLAGLVEDPFFYSGVFSINPELRT